METIKSHAYVYPNGDGYSIRYVELGRIGVTETLEYAVGILEQTGWKPLIPSNWPRWLQVKEIESALLVFQRQDHV